ncbi:MULTISPECIES: DKNYY domain-containing protein [Burkholderia]|uniref:Lipoprotein n=1 Tax=Burkholderia paludis TaxID=1506587 RepID=A0A6J5DE15_9BURK|nr:MULTISPECIES: hypothetical protein [Burkholderia]CAB3752193.1 hypothetical protein LMG30113_01685 [Burkholderia paludis]VWB48686.1 hypothetical protein BPA30113_02085 [Burkholderia paludis]
MHKKTLQAGVRVNLRSSARVRRALVLALALLGVAGSAHAYTVNVCREYWYPLARAGKSMGALAAERGGTCGHPAVKMLSDQYGVVDGRGYFISELHEYNDSCSHGGPVPDFACLLPSSLRRHEDNETRHYYLLTQRGAALRVLDRLHATDGQQVFDGADVIPGADPATFKTFVPKGAKATDGWAYDRNHVYLEERSDPRMVPGPVEVVGATFAVNAGRVFSIDALDGPVYRPDVKAQLQLLSPPATLQPALISDGEHVYLGQKPMDGVRAATFQMLVPVCPVPGAPDLKCVPDAQPDEFRVARSGQDVLYFHEFDDIKRIANVPDFVYFLMEGSSYLGLGGKQIFDLDPLHQNFGGKTITAGVQFSGHLSGPAAGYLADELGFINLRSGLSRNDGPLCGALAKLAAPTPELAHRFGPLRAIAPKKLPAGYSVGYENSRYRYLFKTAVDTTLDDTVVDLGNGKRMRATWCGDDIQLQGTNNPQ